MTSVFEKEEVAALTNCTLCPRECGVNRFREGSGYCGTDAGFNIASICIHRGEEPPVSGPHGICNVFFSGCNLKCIYCQNHDISRACASFSRFTMEFAEVIEKISSILQTGVKSLGFVSPSHQVPQMKAIIREIKERGFSPVVVYNTNGYDKVEVLREIQDLIDVYLPDFKYVSKGLSAEYSDAPGYPEVALKALKEMYYQKGSRLHLDENGIAVSGILVRHLVLPGHSDESIKVLRTISEELSPGVSLSLMSQYHPVKDVIKHQQLGRTLYTEEYLSVVEEMHSLGFRNGWVQDSESSGNYLPDFSRDHPFESGASV